MPFPDSEYPSVVRGRDKRDSQRLLAAAPELLDAANELLDNITKWGMVDETYSALPVISEGIVRLGRAIRKAEGRASE